MKKVIVNKVIFRVDSGAHIGIGHLMRCLTLAEGFYDNDFEVFFLTKRHYGHFINIIPNKFNVQVMSNFVEGTDGSEEINDYESWLGNDLAVEINECNEFIKKVGDQDTLLVIDHYGLSHKFESKVISNNIFAIDDIFRSHNCNFLLDQNISASEEKYRSKAVSSNCKYLMGPSFAMLRKDFLPYRESKLSEKSEVKNILVSFGGSDEKCDSLKLVKAFEGVSGIKLHVTVVLKKEHPSYSEINSIGESLEHDFRLIDFCEDFPALMAASDLFIGAGGSTSWERCFLGLPAVIVSSALNQDLICQSLSDKEIVIFLGKSEDVSIELWVNELNKVISGDYCLLKMSSRAKDIVDGLGVSRIVNLVTN
ncbi:UDP-2,4-diacetamido-2,4,6-trideoxy-beta-L-altropyranose hydrolase [Halobacteriovorax marinus]|uniref:UDP-2,4-diacetamido-2,4, 6-trideoxy-beta-L-altropyranose hydrolase n=1 Tax=Halobacteriovorax marinus TaxID=97084 RepID=A0A1Y5FBH1_9BACT|nr:UDP-2,4-diacetamido-2,4,6-trideoxy-beta-L-altropyranose hydrolase [Halobacteriovorax marinus]